MRKAPRISPFFLSVLGALCFLILPVQAQTGARPLSLDLSQTNSTPAKPLEKPPIKEVAPGVFELGKVRLSKKTHTVTFPAVVNMRDGVVEYWLVNTGGKVHESVLRTDAQPYHIHLAMLLIGGKGRPNLTPQQRVEDKNTYGDTIAIWAEWEENGKKIKCRAEDMVQDKAAKATMSKGDWIYNGSWIYNGVFVAQRELSIVAVIHDHDALINNPRPRRDDDENWYVETKAVPPKETPVTVTIELIKPYAKAKKDEANP